jgi:6-pyruvoyltetrahydropterin/6-carboxytetrahydropterin synthase
LHGHTWVVELELEGKVPGDTGMVINFTELKELINYFDHAYINDLFPRLPTAENLADFFTDKLVGKQLFSFVKVKVWESDHAYAEDEWGDA